MNKETAYRIEIKVEAPPSNPDTSHFRSSVFSFSMESPLPMEQIQRLTHAFVASLTEAAFPGDVK